ncbi:PREDICTED: larval cuticle protein F1-like, partial [Nicrophorus vespilloides]|uniref:Larval cuticle protein F1-like n=1 Tax=Nicrophorus vespilloides TaxID=110193 RepID=A0ABM1MLL6_NICVS
NMFAKVFIVAAVVACVAAAPGYLHAAPIAVPLATSHTSRIDIHSKPILTVSAPIIKTVVAAPIIVPAAVSHASR